MSNESIACLRHPVPVRERCAMDASFAIEHVESLLGRLDEQLELTVEDGRPLIHRHAANPSPPRARGPRSVLPEVLAVHHDAPLRPPRIEVQVDVDVRSRFVPLPNVHRVPGAIFHEGGPYCQGVFLPRRWVIAKVAQVPGLPPALVLRPPRYPPIGEQHSFLVVSVAPQLLLLRCHSPSRALHQHRKISSLAIVLRGTLRSLSLCDALNCDLSGISDRRRALRLLHLSLGRR
mmetsp:Transcript_3833/g.14931  ORF Transcript_3833/g.14931 Transcript_3833/m.14931 type:complete len:233 (+) Transcript_3833:474-1172(+)